MDELNIKLQSKLHFVYMCSKAGKFIPDIGNLVWTYIKGVVNGSIKLLDCSDVIDSFFPRSKKLDSSALLRLCMGHPIIKVYLPQKVSKGFY
jgi:hypothetical protein